MTKDSAMLEVVYDILSKIHSNLCRSKKISQAEELQDIMRRLILFSQKVDSTKITENTMTALTQMGEKVHRKGRHDDG